jgi:hypothetical protein
MAGIDKDGKGHDKDKAFQHRGHGVMNKDAIEGELLLRRCKPERHYQRTDEGRLREPVAERRPVWVLKDLGQEYPAGHGQYQDLGECQQPILHTGP